MVVDRLVMADTQDTSGRAAQVDDYLGGRNFGALGSVGRSSRRIFVPPEWAPWGLLSAGVLTVLYGATVSPSTSNE